MTTSLSSYKTQLATAQAAYQAALQSLYGAMIDLEALTATVEHCGGGPQVHFPASVMDAWQDLFALLEHPVAAPRATHFGGALVANAATATSSAVLHFASVPSWVVAGLVAVDATTGAALGTVLSTTSTTVTLAANAANAVTAADNIAFNFGPSGRIRDKVNAAMAAYIAAWSGS